MLIRRVRAIQKLKYAEVIHIKIFKNLIPLNFNQFQIKINFVCNFSQLNQFMNHVNIVLEMSENGKR